MAKYRRREIVDATQWHKGDPLLPGMSDDDQFECVFIVKGDSRTEEVHDGDWVINSPCPFDGGDLHLCKPDIFAATYELVE